MLARGHITPIEGSKESDNLSSNHLSKEMTMLVLLHLMTKILKKKKKKIKCKKVGHRIIDCKVQIVEEKQNIIQSNLTTKHNSSDVRTGLYGVFAKSFICH